MNRGARLLLPVLALALAAVAIYTKPWTLYTSNGQSGAALPSLSSPTPTEDLPQPLPYLHSHDRKLTATALQQILYTTSLSWQPNHPIRVVCAHDPQKVWDYVCTDAYLHEVWAYKVNSAHVTDSAMIAHNGRRICTTPASCRT